MAWIHTQTPLGQCLRSMYVDVRMDGGTDGGRDGWMNGWSGREAKAVTAIKQIHRWGTGGHAYEEAAFNATRQKYFEV